MNNIMTNGMRWRDFWKMLADRNRFALQGACSAAFAQHRQLPPAVTAASQPKVANKTQFEKWVDLTATIHERAFRRERRIAMANREPLPLDTRVDSGLIASDRVSYRPSL